MPEFYPIVPAGDVELILEYPAEKITTRLGRLYQQIPTHAGLDFRRSNRQPMRCSQDYIRSVGGGPRDPNTSVHTDISTETEVSNQQLENDPEVDALAISKENSAAIPSENCVRIRVSSQHLVLASPYFKRNLESGMLESHTLGAEGRVNISMKDQNPEIMLIVMNIIHGRTRKVPRIIKLDLLTEIAILVDYLECHEAVEPFSDLWIKCFQNHQILICSKPFIQWICISIVFDRNDLLTKLTRAVLRQAKGPIQTLGLPIPENAVDKINHRRNFTINRLLLALEDLLDDFRQDRPACAFQCNAMRYGALTKELSYRGLLFPRPQIPFVGFSFNDIVQSISDIQDPQWGDNMSSHKCQLRSLIESIIQHVGYPLTEVNLSKYVQIQ